MKNVTWQIALSSVILTGLTPAYAATATFSMETGAPSGFEDLTEPTTLVVDVYYGNRLLSENQQATITPGTLNFTNPKKLLQLLPETTDAEEVLERLSQTLPNNSHLSCRPHNRARCGVVDTDVLEIIYDPDRFRVDIFIGAEYLLTNAALQDPYLPPATNRFAVSQRFSGSWSGSQTGDADTLESQSYSLYSSSIISFGESSVRGNWSYSDTPGLDREQSSFRVSDLYWTQDFRGKAVSAGLFQPVGNNSRFVNFGSVYGLEFYRSENTRIDANISSGTPVEVHMPVRGRVEVYREDRLIHGEMLEAGNQLISSAHFPQGAYDIDVRTYSEDGRLLNEFQQFFAKDSRLPPAGEWQWNIMAGTPAEISNVDTIPELSDQVILQAGAGRRLLDNFGLIGGVAASEDSQVLELGARWISQYADITPELVATDAGHTGARVNLSLRSKWATLSYQEARMDDSPRVEPDDLLSATYNFRTASLNVPVGQGRLNARYTERDTGLVIEDTQLALADRSVTGNRLQTLEFQHPIFRNRFWNGDMRLSYSEGGEEQLWSLNVQFRRNKGRWSNSSYMRAETDNTNVERYFGGFTSTWNDRDLWAPEFQQQLNVEGGDQNATLRSQTRFAGRRGSISSYINYLSADSNTLSYTGSFNTTLASDGDFFSWGGEDGYNSSVLVDINGADDEDFEILVNGSRRGYATGGEKSLISVPSYENYQISVRPLGDGFYNYQDNSETVTIYPGNMATTQYEIKTLVLVMGQLIKDGKPLSGVKFSIGNQSVTTDQYGIFQLEYFAAPGKREFTHVVWNDCRVPVPEQSAAKNWVNLGTVELDRAFCKKQSKSNDNQIAHLAP